MSGSTARRSRGGLVVTPEPGPRHSRRVASRGRVAAVCRSIAAPSRCSCRCASRSSLPCGLVRAASGRCPRIPNRLDASSPSGAMADVVRRWAAGHRTFVHADLPGIEGASIAPGAGFERLPMTWPFTGARHPLAQVETSGCPEMQGSRVSARCSLSQGCRAAHLPASIPPASPRRDRALSADPGASGEFSPPRQGRMRQAPAQVRGERVPTLPRVRTAGSRLCSSPLRGLWSRASGPVFLQASGDLPVLQCPPHVEHCGSLGRPRHPRRTPSTVGAQRAFRAPPAARGQTRCAFGRGAHLAAASGSVSSTEPAQASPGSKRRPGHRQSRKKIWLPSICASTCMQP